MSAALTIVSSVRRHDLAPGVKAIERLELGGGVLRLQTTENLVSRDERETEGSVLGEKLSRLRHHRGRTVGRPRSSSLPASFRCVVRRTEHLAVPALRAAALDPGDDVVGLIPAPTYASLFVRQSRLETFLAETVLGSVDANPLCLVE